MSNPTSISRLGELLRLPTNGDSEAFADLGQLVKELHADGNHFAAGFGWEQGAALAWGRPDEYAGAIRKAAVEYLEAVETAERCSAAGLAATVRLVNITGREPPMGLGLPSDVVNTALTELGNLILSCSTLVGGSAHLVRGMWVETDLNGTFDLVVQEREVEPGSQYSGPGYLKYAIPSPFQLLIGTADYAGAARVASMAPEAITTAGLRGWRAAVHGFVEPNRAVEFFDEAASEFALDVPPGPDDVEGGPWTSRNLGLWGPYFRARSRLALAVREPTKARQHIAEAAALAPLGASGWVDTEVQRFSALVACLRRLTDGEAFVPMEAIRREFLSAAGFGGPTHSDPLVGRFIELVELSLDGFVNAPALEITGGRLMEALSLLDRLPLLEPGIAVAARTAIGERVLDVLLGPRSWVFERLAAIRDERVLQRLVLRLARVSLPVYAQVLHGPLEYGKDVVVLVVVDGTTELRMYQAKVGTIDTRVWRLAKQELEAMFEVSLPPILTGGRSPDRRVGYLVTNGHAGINVAPEMQGWFDLQRERLGRDIRFLHIDGLVRWVYDEHLLNEFRSFVDDEGLG